MEVLRERRREVYVCMFYFLHRGKYYQLMYRIVRITLTNYAGCHPAIPSILSARGVNCTQRTNDAERLCHVLAHPLQLTSRHSGQSLAGTPNNTIRKQAKVYD